MFISFLRFEESQLLISGRVNFHHAMLGARPQRRTLQLLHNLRNGTLHKIGSPGLRMADKMSTLSPRDAKVTSVEPMVSLCLGTEAATRGHTVAHY